MRDAIKDGDFSKYQKIKTEYEEAKAEVQKAQTETTTSNAQTKETPVETTSTETTKTETSSTPKTTETLPEENDEEVTQFALKELNRFVDDANKMFGYERYTSNHESFDTVKGNISKYLNSESISQLPDNHPDKKTAIETLSKINDLQASKETKTEKAADTVNQNKSDLSQYNQVTIDTRKSLISQVATNAVRGGADEEKAIEKAKTALNKFNQQLNAYIRD